MWLFRRPEQPEDVRRQLRDHTERLESLERRYGSLVADVEEFYAKVNKARQRVVKEERDAAAASGGKGGGAGDPVGVAELPREVLKAQLRARMRAGGR